MMHPEEYACPLCGLALPSLADYHRHWGREHARRAAGRVERQDRYENGCPILDDGVDVSPK